MVSQRPPSLSLSLRRCEDVQVRHDEQPQVDLNHLMVQSQPSAIKSKQDEVYREGAKNIEGFDRVRSAVEQLIIEGPEFDSANDLSYALVD